MSESRTRRSSLARQLLWLGALPAVVMFLVLITYFTAARLDDVRRDLTNSSQVLADNLAPAVEYAVVSGNRAALQQILEQSIRRTDVEWIRVLDVMDEEMGFVHTDDEASTAPDPEELVFESEILQQPVSMQANDQAEWFEPNYTLGAGALRVGTVQVGVSPDLLAAKRANILWTSLGLGLALLAFTLIIVKRMLTRIVGPIQGLSDHVRKLINRDYRTIDIAERGAAAEVSELAHNLNALAIHLANLKESRDQTLAISEHARERAENANLAKSEFLAVMSHELRTPLNGVLGMVELVGDEHLSPRQQEYLKTAKRSTEDLLTVITDILDFSRLDRGKLVLDSSEFDLRSVIQNCAATFSHPAREKNLELVTQFDGPWPQRARVRGDAPRLRQILACLVDNAIKFTEEGDITIHAAWQPLDANCITLSCEVRDSGAGIPSERMKEIFNSFEQLDSSHSRRHGGTGIGLALVQRLVELMGGHVRVETDLGLGSSFLFEIPFEMADGEPAPAPADREPATTSPRPDAHALVVEDNLVNQRVATALLTRLGFQAEAVSHGHEAVERVKANGHYAVILMDCQMPVMDGYEATRAIREWELDKGLPEVPIIALTADALPGTETACREAGMNDYLAKPVRKDNLRAVLSRWVRV
ncbi:MAG: ATP-binding protein [Marinobacter sp.]|uniref:hybrid sensor histidine kinase/response regulator n=1 Tax=Marinobacter sp. TaxID=50741 RepID=UPI00299EEA5A|nr:ATP-binding protein [Marinobacter sp.]MDX1634557.1 ATP-binding protein [Marinobacter sp.]